MSHTQVEASTQSEVTFFRSNEATIARLDIFIGGEWRTWTGTAKTFPGDHTTGVPADKPNSSIGDRLALGRALKAAGNRLERQANGLTKSIDDNRKHASEAKSRPKPEVFKVKPRVTKKKYKDRKLKKAQAKR